jgi:hypothetical protein
MDDLTRVFNDIRIAVAPLHSLRDRFYNEDALNLLNLKVEAMGAAGMLDLYIQRVENLIDQGQRLTQEPLQGHSNFPIGDPTLN